MRICLILLLDIVTNTQTISEKFNYIYPHNGLIITFKAAFLNVEKKLGGITKHGKVSIGGVDYQFSGEVQDDYYGCVSQSTSTKRDGKNSISLSIAHTKQAFSMSFVATDLGSVARLGLADLIIYAILCDDNATFASQICICNTGYQPTNILIDTKDNYFRKCVLSN